MAPAFAGVFLCPFLRYELCNQGWKGIRMKKALLFPLVFIFTISFAQTDSLKLDSLELEHTIVPKPQAPSAEVYTLKPAVDIPLTVAGTGWSLYAFTKIYSKDTSTTAQILALDKNNLAAINRSGVKQYSPKAASASDLIFYGSMPLPLLLLADREIRKDAGKVGLIFLESMSVTGLLYTGSVYFKDKYRPYAYNPDVPIEKRKGGGGKNSFFAGHVALVGTSTFFMAKVLSDYHPESKIKWLLFTTASAATLTTAYLRYKGGMHFTTDILIGTALGPLSGILVPHFHKTRKDKENRLSLVPYFGQEKGVAMVYRF